MRSVLGDGDQGGTNGDRDAFVTLELGCRSPVHADNVPTLRTLALFATSGGSPSPRAPIRSTRPAGPAGTWGPSGPRVPSFSVAFRPRMHRTMARERLGGRRCSTCHSSGGAGRCATASRDAGGEATCARANSWSQAAPPLKWCGSRSVGATGGPTRSDARRAA